MGPVDADHSCRIKRGAGGPISADWCIERFAPILAGLPADLREEDVARPDLLIHQESIGAKLIQIYYTPFDGPTNTAAKVMLVGITPGRHQLHLALRAARAALHEGCSYDEAIQRADQTASFAGSMRTNAVTMMDNIGLADALGIATCASLFGEHANLCDSTSAICHAVFVNGSNYTGTNLAKIPIFSSFAVQVLGGELEAAAEALIIPFGDAATQAVRLSVAAGRVAEQRCLLGFPHPSGANGHRRRLFAREHERLTAGVTAWSQARP